MRHWLAALMIALALLSPPILAREAQQQGRQANLHGQEFEHAIRDAVAQWGFTVTGYAEWREAGRPKGDFLLTNAPYTTLYGTPGRTEFLLLSERLGLEIRIEAKFKAVAGSFDEKLPYVYLNAIEAPERQVFVVIDGSGWRPGSVEWLRQTVSERRFGIPDDKRITVFDLAEFRHWADRLRPPP